MIKENKIQVLAFIILAGFALGVAGSYIMGAYLKAPNPYNTFLSNPSFSFNDFYDTYTSSSNLNPYLTKDKFPSYFPFAHFLGFFFNFLKPGIALAFFLILFIGIISNY